MKLNLRFILSLLFILEFSFNITAAAIDRQALVSRHTITMTDVVPLSPLSVGNGRFAFTADITGLQTFPGAYEKGIPLATMAEWGWHSFANPSGYQLEDTFVDIPTGDRAVPYDIENKSPAAQWLRANPHQTNLACIGLILKKADGGDALIGDIKKIRQQLDLWTGLLTSTFEFNGAAVTVITACHPDQDAVAVRIQSDLLSQNRIGVKLAFPYPAGQWGPQISDWNNTDRHITEIKKQTETGLEILHDLDTLKYTVAAACSSGTKIEHPQQHQYHFLPTNEKTTWECVIVFSNDKNQLAHTNSFDTVLEKQKAYWKKFWSSGGAIELSKSKDPRAKELERRIILSQYLTAIQSQQKYPPAETGLTCPSWFGKFHLEMHWWHSVHFALWNRFNMAAPGLDYYIAILPEARKIAQRQGYKGARWPKMTDPAGQDSPSGIGPLLIWQQPHPIYYAELAYRQNPAPATLDKYKDIVFETAEFMASFPAASPDSKYFELGPPLISAREYAAGQYTINKNPAYELAYWRWGLVTAGQWRKRLGLPAESKWQEAANNLAPWPIDKGVYVEQQFPLVEDGGHPCMLAAYGVLPASPQLDKKVMEKTLEHVLNDWKWDDTWGWDYPMIAMTAARLGRGDLAVKALLLDVTKNTYLPNGHNFQRENLPCYLPGNGGLLTAAAMMAAGWDNCPDKHAPGFPDDGLWTVEYENLSRMP